MNGYLSPALVIVIILDDSFITFFLLAVTPPSANHLTFCDIVLDIYEVNHVLT